jgi:hypothetical protein
VVPI